MAKGLALTIGLNTVDPRHYAGWNGRLAACEADARDMADIARARKFTVRRLLTRSATRRAVLAGIASAAGALRSGDIFLLTYSGHGGQVPDRNHDEPDLQDETWCLYDGELIDDEIYQALTRFKAGVRVLVLSDSCHSGTVTKAMFYAARAETSAGSGADGAEPIRYRNMPREVALRTYRAHRAMYDKPGCHQGRSPCCRARRGHSHLGLPGQPAFPGRPVQRPVHRQPLARVEGRALQGELSRVPQRDRPEHAARPDAEALHHRRVRARLREATAVHGIARPGSGGLEARCHE